MNSTPLVSIILPAYNAQDYVRESIDSIIGQTYTNWELLIADDGSSDATRIIIDTYSDARIKKLHNKRNMGPFPTRNRLLSLAEGELITFQDADDISHPERLERQVEALKQDDELGIVGTWIEVVLEDKSPIHIMKYPENDADIKKLNQTKNAFFNPTVMVRKSVYEKVGGFRQYLINGFSNQDYDWTYLVSDQCKSRNIPEILYSYRQLGNSVSKRVDPKRLIGAELVQFLGKRRRENNGEDYLYTGETEIVDQYVDKLLEPYKKDKTLVYRDYASKYMYAGLKKNAIRISWMAVRAEPGRLINWRTLFYCLRKSTV